MTPSVRSMDEAVGKIDLELSLVEGAITMVAAGTARTVSLGGLRFGELLIRPARRIAFQAGVRVVPLWTADDEGADLRIERLDHD